MFKRISEMTGESLKNVRNVQKEEREALLEVLQLQQVDGRLVIPSTGCISEVRRSLNKKMLR